MTPQGIKSRRINRPHRLSISLTLNEKMLDQLAHILRSFAQGRQPDWNHIESKIKIFTKLSLIDQLSQVTMR